MVAQRLSESVPNHPAGCCPETIPFASPRHRGNTSGRLGRDSCPLPPQVVVKRELQTVVVQALLCSGYFAASINGRDFHVLAVLCDDVADLVSGGRCCGLFLSARLGLLRLPAIHCVELPAGVGDTLSLLCNTLYPARRRPFYEAKVELRSRSSKF